MEQTESIAASVRAFILDTYWLGDLDADALTDTTELVDIGIVDSMNVLKLVDFIEETFDFMLDPEDLFGMRTIAGIVDVICEKAGTDQSRGG